MSLQAATNAAGIQRIRRLVERGQIDVAEKQVWDIVSNEPENTAGIDLLGVIRTKQKRLPEAEALFKRAIARRRASPILTVISETFMQLRAATMMRKQRT